MTAVEEAEVRTLEKQHSFLRTICAALTHQRPRSWPSVSGPWDAAQPAKALCFVAGSARPFHGGFWRLELASFSWETENNFLSPSM